MKTKIVLWGTNEQDEKLLIALSLVPESSQVNVFTFPSSLVTEEFTNLMMKDWRANKEVTFPEGHVATTSELSLSGNLLPEGIKVDKQDILQRAQTEWQFVVLSQKLKDSFDSELEELKDKINQLSNFDSGIWEELKSYWNKVQNQVRERNLFREHANNLKDRTNELFTQLKSLRKKLDEEFTSKSKESLEKFSQNLENIEKKIQEGLSLQPIFEDLKNLQREFKNATFTREDRSKTWNRIDKAFKTVKEKRFGKSDNNKYSPVDRLKRRYDGLITAINKMEKSIGRDKQDFKFEQDRIESSEGQLEAQIRQAKIKMIEERIRSKNEKLQDMYKTKESLDAKMEVEKQKMKSKEEQDRIKEAKKEIKEKIAADIKKAKEERKDEIDKLSGLLDKSDPSSLEGNTDSIKATQDSNEENSGNKNVESTEKKNGDDVKAASKAAEDSTNKNEDEKVKTEPKPEEESLLGAMASVIGESVEDVVDTVKAVASVVSDKIEEKIEQLTGEEE